MKEIADEEVDWLKEVNYDYVYPDRELDKIIKLGYPFPNIFMPDPKNLVSKKVPRPIGGNPAVPK